MREYQQEWKQWCCCGLQTVALRKRQEEVGEIKTFSFSLRMTRMEDIRGTEYVRCYEARLRGFGQVHRRDSECVSKRMLKLLTCSFAWEIQVLIRSSSLDVWYFLVVLTAMKMSSNINKSWPLCLRGPPAVPLRSPDLLGTRFSSFVLSVSSNAFCPAKLMTSLVVDSAFCESSDAAETPLERWGRCGLTWARGRGQSSCCAGGLRAGMSRNRRPQSARAKRKQSLLMPIEAMCILTGGWIADFSLQGCSHLQNHPVPSSQSQGVLQRHRGERV